MTLGQRLKQIRLDHKLNQGEVGKVANLSVPYLSDMENDKVNPSVDTIRKIAESYDIALSDLLVGVGTKQLDKSTSGMPESFKAFLLTDDLSDEVTGDWSGLLLSIHLRGVRPKHKRDWMSLYFLLRRILR